MLLQVLVRRVHHVCCARRTSPPLRAYDPGTRVGPGAHGWGVEGFGSPAGFGAEIAGAAGFKVGSGAHGSGATGADLMGTGMGTHGRHCWLFSTS
jgi:hypothetical protein